MDLTTGLAYAVQGRAVLFVGAGFSFGAKSLSDEEFLLGAELGKLLAGEAGVPAALALEDVADIYVSKFGPQALLQKLRNLYVAKDVTQGQRELAKLPWRYVYTTNYDDVFERACVEVGRDVVSRVGTESVGRLTKKGLTCIHLNGFIRTATEDSLSSELKLTSTSYSSGSAMNDEWADRFRFDLHAAQAIFFVGYSLADLDVRRLLLEEELREKSFFVLKENPNAGDAHRANSFGSLVAIGVDAFAEEIRSFVSTYALPPDSAPISHCIRPFIPQNPSEPAQDRYLFELVLAGKLRTEFIPQSFLGQTVYVGVRTAMTRFSQVLEPGVGVIFLHSNLGNGKSIAMALAQYTAFQKGFNVYSLNDRGETLSEELHYAAQKEDHTVIFVDNYPEWLDVLSAFRGRIGKDLSLVLSARTASHDALAERVSDVIAWHEGLEFDLDSLDDAELEWVSAYLDHFGFWQEMAGSGSYEKMRFLKEKCGGQWSSILLKVFEAPQILERLNALLGEFNRTSEFRDSLLKLLLLSVLGYHPNSPSVITLCGDEVLSRSFRTNGTVNELIDFSGNSFAMRSSVVSTVILKRISDPNRVIRALIGLITQVDRLADSSDYHWELFKNLVRFRSMNLIFPDESRGRAAMRVYEEIKSLSHCSRYPLFWLQYAIAALVAKDFQRSKAYFDTAYSLADRLEHYDAFQIDNHYALFLLERAIESDCSPSDRMAPFREARRLLRPQFNEEWRHYPYRVATSYFDFLSRFSVQLSHAEKQEIRGAAEEILERIARLSDEMKFHRSIRDCQAAQQKILRIT